MNRLTLYLLVYALAAVFFGWETYRAWTDPVLPGKAVPAGVPFSRPVFALPPKADPGNVPYAGLSAVLARPVFRPDRRPYQREASASQRNYEVELSRYTVLGVLFVGDEKKALVVSRGSGAGGRWEVGAGDSLAGFTVKEVTPDGLTLAADRGEYFLPLYAGGPKAAAGTSLRTEVAPAPPAAPPSFAPPLAAGTAPGGAGVPSSAEAAQSPASLELRRLAPSPAPQITYPRRYAPGRR